MWVSGNPNLQLTAVSSRDVILPSLFFHSLGMEGGYFLKLFLNKESFHRELCLLHLQQSVDVRAGVLYFG